MHIFREQILRLNQEFSYKYLQFTLVMKHSINNTAP